MEMLLPSVVSVLLMPVVSTRLPVMTILVVESSSASMVFWIFVRYV